MAEFSDATKDGAASRSRCHGSSTNTSICPLDYRQRVQPSGNAEETDGPSVDLDAACAFLALLGSSFTFQTFDETGQKRGRLNRVLHGTLAKHAEALIRLNQQGAGVFVMVNAGDGKGRRADNVQAVRAIFADLDGAPLDPIYAADLMPHVIVQSSPGRWHVYWLVDGVPLEQFKLLQQVIAAKFHSDPKVCDLPRVMRLPGFLHNKGEPFLSRVLQQNDMPLYTLAVLVKSFGPMALPKAAPVAKASARGLPNVIPEGDRNNTLFDLACGFVRSGIAAAGVNDRLQRMNAERCTPPLDANEVDTIAGRASSYGSQGFMQLPHALLDSTEWLALPPASCAIVLAFYRRFTGFNNGRLCIPWSDFSARHGIDTSGRFYKYLRRAVSAGLLIQTAGPHNSQTGRIPAMYAIPEQYLAQVSKRHMGPSVKTAHLNR